MHGILPDRVFWKHFKCNAHESAPSAVLFVTSLNSFRCLQCGPCLYLCSACIYAHAAHTVSYLSHTQRMEGSVKTIHILSLILMIFHAIGWYFHSGSHGQQSVWNAEPQYLVQDWLGRWDTGVVCEHGWITTCVGVAGWNKKCLWCRNVSAAGEVELQTFHLAAVPSRLPFYFPFIYFTLHVLLSFCLDFLLLWVFLLSCSGFSQWCRLMTGCHEKLSLCIPLAHWTHTDQLNVHVLMCAHACSQRLINKLSDVLYWEDPNN